jgi:hypothetical protein
VAGSFLRATFLVSCVICCAAAAPVSAANLVPGTNCPVFPSDSWWHADVSQLPVHAKSAQWLSHMSPTRKLHPDFGPSFGAQSVPYGIPITVVDGSHPTVTVSFDFDSESDHVSYPLGADSKVEGGQFTSGDRHVIMVNSSTCRLYETWATRKSGQAWLAGSGATWKLTSNALRPVGWTSADAAGLPILPGLLRYEEVASRSIDHAIRFTTDITDRRFHWPARHQAGSVSNGNYPPMGARFRLKADYVISTSLRADTRAVLAAMKKYGLVLADNGSPWYFQGTSDTRWTSGMLDQLKNVPASAFEAVDTISLKITGNSMQVTAPPAARSPL